MPNTKITDLTSLTAASGDEIPVNRAGTDGKITAGDIAALASGSVPGDPGADRVLLWDETDNTVKWLQLANVATEAGPATGDYLLVQRAEDDLVKVNWSVLDSLFLTSTEADLAYQPLDGDLTSWAAVTRAAGYDTFAATPTAANLGSLVTDDAFLLSDAELGAIAGLTSAANTVPYFTGLGSAALMNFTPSDAGFDVVVAWDDTASTYKSILLADITTEAAPAAGDYALIYGAEGDLRKVDWSNMGGSSLPADPGADRVLMWDETDNTTKWLQLANIATEGSPAAGDYLLVQRAEDDLVKVNWSSLSGAGQTPWTQDIDADGFDLLFDDATGIKSSEATNPSLLLFESVANAVNYLNIKNSAAAIDFTSDGPSFWTEGDDDTINIDFYPKGLEVDPEEFGKVRFINRFDPNTYASFEAYPDFPSMEFNNSAGNGTIYIDDAANFTFIAAADLIFWGLDNTANISFGWGEDGLSEYALNLVGVINATNYLTITNAATGDGPIISATGSDERIHIGLRPKCGDTEGAHVVISDANEVFLGTIEYNLSPGDSAVSVGFVDSDGNDAGTFGADTASLSFSAEASHALNFHTEDELTTFSNGDDNLLVLSPVTGGTGVNYLTVTNAVTLASPTIAAVGTDSTLGMNLSLKVNAAAQEIANVLISSADVGSSVRFYLDSDNLGAGVQFVSDNTLGSAFFQATDPIASFETESLALSFTVGEAPNPIEFQIYNTNLDDNAVVLTLNDNGGSAPVNYFTITNAATGSPPILAPTGDLPGLSFGAAFTQYGEMTAPAGVANTARLFCQDNGAGKTQLCVIFPTGAATVIATEP